MFATVFWGTLLALVTVIVLMGKGRTLLRAPRRLGAMLRGRHSMGYSDRRYGGSGVGHRPSWWRKDRHAADMPARDVPMAEPQVASKAAKAVKAARPVPAPLAAAEGFEPYYPLE